MIVETSSLKGIQGSTVSDAHTVMMKYMAGQAVIKINKDRFVLEGHEVVLAAIELGHYPQLRVVLAEPLSSPHTPQSGVMCITHDQTK